MSHDTIYLLLFINLIFIVASVYMLLKTINNLKTTQNGIKARLWEVYASNYDTNLKHSALEKSHNRLFRKTMPAIAGSNINSTLIKEMNKSIDNLTHKTQSIDEWIDKRAYEECKNMPDLVFKPTK